MLFQISKNLGKRLKELGSKAKIQIFSCNSVGHYIYFARILWHKLWFYFILSHFIPPKQMIHFITSWRPDDFPGPCKTLKMACITRNK